MWQILMTNQRIQQIEEKLAFLEFTNTQLEDEVYRQQGEIDALKKSNRMLQDRLNTIEKIEDFDDEPAMQCPPHY